MSNNTDLEKSFSKIISDYLMDIEKLKILMNVIFKEELK